LRLCRAAHRGVEDDAHRVPFCLSLSEIKSAHSKQASGTFIICTTVYRCTAPQPLFRDPAIGARELDALLQISGS
jgi:hypothetical protein